MPLSLSRQRLKVEADDSVIIHAGAAGSEMEFYVFLWLRIVQSPENHDLMGSERSGELIVFRDEESVPFPSPP